MRSIMPQLASPYSNPRDSRFSQRVAAAAAISLIVILLSAPLRGEHNSWTQSLTLNSFTVGIFVISSVLVMAILELHHRLQSAAVPLDTAKGSGTPEWN